MSAVTCRCGMWGVTAAECERCHDMSDDEVSAIMALYEAGLDICWDGDGTITMCASDLAKLAPRTQLADKS